MSPWQFLRWVTVVLNVAMVVVVVNGVRVAQGNCEGFDVWRIDACRSGSGPGSGVSLGVIVFVWVAGNVLLRVPHLFQRPHRSTSSPQVHGQGAGPGPGRAEPAAADTTDPLGVDVQYLRRLAGLRDDGILTEEEFTEQKTRLLAGPGTRGSAPSVDVDRLRTVAALRDEEILTEAEFESQKAMLLGAGDEPVLDVDGLRRLGALRSDGILTDEEFAAQKKRLLPEARRRTPLVRRPGRSAR